MNDKSELNDNYFSCHETRQLRIHSAVRTPNSWAAHRLHCVCSQNTSWSYLLLVMRCCVLGLIWTRQVFVLRSYNVDKACWRLTPSHDDNLHIHTMWHLYSLPPLDNIRVMVIAWRLRTALCGIVWYNVHSHQHTYICNSYRSNRLCLSHWDPYAMRRSGCLES